jgi:hypothetical protein
MSALYRLCVHLSLATFLSLILSGCSAEVAKSNDRLIFGENILNLAVIEGSSIESNCLVPIDPKTTSFLGCVIFPLESEGLEGKDLVVKPMLVFLKSLQMVHVTTNF